MTVGPRSYRHSRCVDPVHAPQQIHFASIDGDANFVHHELVNAVRPHVHPNAMPDVVGEMRAVLERIEACRAIDPDHIKNITRNRDLWEIRFQMRSFDLVIRIYETEIGELPRHLVALLAHQKVTDVDEGEIADMQNAEIDEATRRWVHGRSTYWGVP